MRGDRGFQGDGNGGLAGGPWIYAGFPRLIFMAYSDEP